MTLCFNILATIFAKLDIYVKCIKDFEVHCWTFGTRLRKYGQGLDRVQGRSGDQTWP